jgi:HK97 gp10 family phage protein
MLKITVNADELVAQLERDTKYLAEKEMRGVVSKAVNVIADDAKQNAIEVGFGNKGRYRTASGEIITRKGQIPNGIYAFTGKNKGSVVPAKVAFDPKKAGGAWYARLLEFGTRKMPPIPFFMRALPEKRKEALAAAQKRLNEAVGRMLG